jgi:hypothetical protein
MADRLNFEIDVELETGLIMGQDCALRLGRIFDCRYRKCDSPRAQHRRYRTRATTSKRHPARAAISGSSPYRRLAFLPAPPPPLGFLGGEGRLFARGSICDPTEPAKDCTCLFDSWAGLA